MKPHQKKQALGSLFKSNFASGLVVFLVALPLCLGIALASGAPPLSGVLAGIVGGIVIGSLSTSHISVSGPAAGLAATILAAITSGSNVPFNKDNFTVQGIYFGDSKKQPALFCKTVLDYSRVGEIPAPDGKNTSYLLVNKSNRETLDELKVSEAARAHLNMSI